MDFLSYGFLVVFEYVSSKYIKTLTKKRARSKLWTKVKKVNKHHPPPLKKIHGLFPIDLKIYGPEKKTKIISVTSISGNFSFTSIKISALSKLGKYHIKKVSFIWQNV
jgi:hypothetical protein